MGILLTYTGRWGVDGEVIALYNVQEHIDFTTDINCGSNSTHNPNMTITAPNNVIGSIVIPPDFLLCI
jgi:hypothetical protein